MARLQRIIAAVAFAIVCSLTAASSAVAPITPTGLIARAGGTSGERVASDDIPGYGTHDRECAAGRECGP